MSDSYLAVFIYVHVLPEAVEAFRAASLANAAASIGEPGCVRFDVGRLGRDQVEDYARRKGVTIDAAEQLLSPRLGYEP